MKKIIFLFVLVSSIVSSSSIAATPNYANNIDIEMFILRKGINVSIAIISNGSEVPTELVIERKSTAPLSNYRKAITLNKEDLEKLRSDGKILLSDEYPESRQLDSYYRIVYTTNQGVVRSLPGIFLSKAQGDAGVTFGDHAHDESIFEKEEDKIVNTYEQYNILFNIKRKDSKVLITIGAKNSQLKGEWVVERKSSAPLATFRRVKTIYGEDLDTVLIGERVFLDAYPESRKLDSYYRLVITDAEGNRIELPSMFLPGDASN